MSRTVSAAANLPLASQPASPPALLARAVVLKFLIYGVNALTGIVTARALDPSGRGELAAMIVWPALLSGLTTIGLPSALVYHLRRVSPDAGPRLAAAALLLSAAAGAGATAVGWVVAPMWLRGQPSYVIAAAQLCLLATVPYSLTVVARSVWEAEGRLDRSHLLQLTSPLVTLAALLPQAILGTLTPQTAAATYILASVPTLVWALGGAIRWTSEALRRLGEAAFDLLRYGSRSYGVDLCAVLGASLDQALIVGLLAPEAVGLYVVAVSLSRVINAIQGSVALTAFPRLVGAGKQQLVAAIGRAARLSALSSALVGIAMIAAGDPLLHLLYGDAFRAASFVLPLLVAEVVVTGAAQVLLQGFLAAGRPGIATIVQGAGLAASVPLFLVMVPARGLTGAAGALLAGAVFRLLFTLVSYPFFLGTSMPSVWIRRADVAELVSYRTTMVQAFVRARPGATG